MRDPQSRNQLLHTMRNLARTEGVAATDLLKKYFLDRFLQTLQRSRFKDQFIVKGGMLISNITGLSTRMTADIDFNVRNLDVRPDNLSVIINEICELIQPDALLFNLNRITQIRDNGPYGGYRAFIDVYFEGIKEHVKLDISSGDVITPGPITMTFTITGAEDVFTGLAYNLETVLAEKIETILTRSNTNSRARDFYDLYILVEMCKDQISQVVFKKAFHRTIENRETEFILANADMIMDEIEQSDNLVKVWKNYQKSTPYARSIDFQSTLKALRYFLSLL